MIRRHSSRSSMRTISRRKRVWCRRTTTLNPTASGATGTVMADMLTPLEAAGASHLGITIGGIRFNIETIGTGTNTTTLTDFKLGFIIAPSTVTTANDYSIVTNPDLDWMYINTFYCQNNSSPVGAIQSMYSTAPDGSYHVRSKRKVEELNQTLYAVGNSDWGTFTALQATVNVSVLVLLP